MLEQKKILVLSGYYLPYISGMSIYTQRLYEFLVKNGYKVTVLTTRHDNSLPKRENINDVEVIRSYVAFKFQRGAYSPTILFNLIRNVTDYDFVIMNMPFFDAGLATIISKIFSKKVFLTYHSDLKISKGLLSKIVSWLYYRSLNIACSLCDKIIVNSMAHTTQSKIKQFVSKVRQIIPPVDTERFDKSKDVKDFKKKYNINPNEKVIGFIGRFAEEKGLRYLVEAMSTINKEIENVRLLFGGTGEKLVGREKESTKEEILKLIEDLKLKNISFLGFLSDKELVDFYSSCDVFVFPSIAIDTFGLVQAEALLCGTPVVTTDMPGTRDLVEMTGFGIKVPPADSVKLAEAVIKILKNKKDFVVSREKLLSILGTEKTAKEYEELFMEYYNK